MIDNARISTDAVRDYDSSAGSTISSVWESSELDLSDGDISDGEKSTDYSGTCSPIEPYKCIDDVEVTTFDSQPTQHNFREMVEVILFRHAVHL